MDLHFLRSGKKGSCILGQLLANQVKQVLNQVFNFSEGVIVVDYQIKKLAFGSLIRSTQKYICKVLEAEDNYNLFFKTFLRGRNYSNTFTCICNYSLVQCPLPCNIDWQSRSQTPWLKCELKFGAGFKPFTVKFTCNPHIRTCLRFLYSWVLKCQVSASRFLNHRFLLAAAYCNPNNQSEAECKQLSYESAVCFNENIKLPYVKGKSSS